MKLFKKKCTWEKIYQKLFKERKKKTKLTKSQQQQTIKIGGLLIIIILAILTISLNYNFKLNRKINQGQSSISGLKNNLVSLKNKNNKLIKNDKKINSLLSHNSSLEREKDILESRIEELNKQLKNMELNTMRSSDYFDFSDHGYNIEIDENILEIKNFLNTEELKNNYLKCENGESLSYFEDLLSNFEENDKAYQYTFIYKNNVDDSLCEYTATIIPNTPGYPSEDKFKEDFQICDSSYSIYPSQVSRDNLLFLENYNSTNTSIKCLDIIKIVESTIILK